MSDTQPPEVQAPFDTLPATASQDGSSSAAVVPRGSRNRVVFVLAGLAVVAAGVGQAIGLSFLFDGDRRDLSHEAAPAAKHSAAAPVELAPQPHPTSSASAPTASSPLDRPNEAERAADGSNEDGSRDEAPAREPHVLDIGRQRLAAGDIDGARRIAAQFLLRLDGLSHEDAERAPEACTLLGDVMRRDYEIALDRARGAVLIQPPAPAPASGPDGDAAPAGKDHR